LLTDNRHENEKGETADHSRSIRGGAILIECDRPSRRVLGASH
jgi:hypothetical protein